jgi:hypothetical protein
LVLVLSESHAQGVGSDYDVEISNHIHCQRVIILNANVRENELSQKSLNLISSSQRIEIKGGPLKIFFNCSVPVENETLDVLFHIEGLNLIQNITWLFWV